MLPRASLLFAAIALALPVAAQQLLRVQVDPAEAKPGEVVTVRAQFDISRGLNCNVRFHFGDGASEDHKVNQEKDATLAVPHRYDKAGRYTVKVEPKTALPALKCLGENQQASVNVTVPPPPAPPAASRPTAASAPAAAKPVAKPAAKPAPKPAPKVNAIGSGPVCPRGWKLLPASVNRQNGAYTCSAPAGTAAPAENPHCPAALRPFVNTGQGLLGCLP
jgi:hypothetical protein